MSMPVGSHPPPDAVENASLPSMRLVPQLWTLWHTLRTSPHRRAIALLAAGIVLVVCLNAVGQIRLNSWQGSSTTRSSRGTWRPSAPSS